MSRMRLHLVAVALCAAAGVAASDDPLSWAAATLRSHPLDGIAVLLRTSESWFTSPHFQHRGAANPATLPQFDRLPPDLPAAERARLLFTLASLLAAAKQPLAAVHARREGFQYLTKATAGSAAGDGSGGSGGIGLADAVETYGTLATDLKDAQQYDEALMMVRRATQTLQKHAPHPASLGILSKLEAAILSCEGQDIEALQRFEEGMRQLGRSLHAAPLSPGGGAASGAMTVEERLMHMDLLQRAAVHGDADGDAHEIAAFGTPTNKTLAPGLQLVDDAAGSRAAAKRPSASGSGRVVPPKIRSKMEAAARRVALSFVDEGPWGTVYQLPKHYLPGLRSQPWHSTDTWPQLKALEALIESYAGALKKEYVKLSKKRLLFPETECIHDAAGGAWRHYSVNGYWLHRDVDGCALDTPVACKLLAESRALGIPGLTILRAGYSSVAGRSHIRPHFGMTNAQLKFHVGLIVPTHKVRDGHAAAGEDPARPCATIRVGNETRAWREGKTLFFDDSYIHAVKNACDKERVVFQVVISHPDLGSVARHHADASGGTVAPDHLSSASMQVGADGQPLPQAQGSVGDDAAAAALPTAEDTARALQGLQWH